MQLIPLSYPQFIVNKSCRRAHYGDSHYITNCRRFTIHQRSRGDWRVDSLVSHDYGWLEWLKSVGIKDTAFATRRAAVEALDVALTADNLMDAQSA